MFQNLKSKLSPDTPGIHALCLQGRQCKLILWPTYYPITQYCKSFGMNYATSSNTEIIT